MSYLFEVLINLNILITFTWLFLSVANSIVIFTSLMQHSYTTINKPLALLWFIASILVVLLPSKEYIEETQNQYKGENKCQTNQD